MRPVALTSRTKRMATECQTSLLANTAVGWRGSSGANTGTGCRGKSEGATEGRVVPDGRRGGCDLTRPPRGTAAVTAPSVTRPPTTRCTAQPHLGNTTAFQQRRSRRSSILRLPSDFLPRHGSGGVACGVWLGQLPRMVHAATCCHSQLPYHLMYEHQLQHQLQFQLQHQLQFQLQLQH